MDGWTETGAGAETKASERLCVGQDIIDKKKCGVRYVRNGVDQLPGGRGGQRRMSVSSQEDDGSTRCERKAGEQALLLQRRICAMKTRDGEDRTMDTTANRVAGWE